MNKDPVSEKNTINPLTSLLDIDVTRYYDPDLIDRPSRFDGANVDRLNSALKSLEVMMSGTAYNTCETQIIICLIVYNRLTHLEIQKLLNMTQSSVSKSVKSLRSKQMVHCSIGKKYEVGRPFQLVILSCSAQQLLSDMINFLSKSVNNLDYILGCNEENRLLK